MLLSKPQLEAEANRLTTYKHLRRMASVIWDHFFVYAKVLCKDSKLLEALVDSSDQGAQFEHLVADIDYVIVCNV